MRCYDFLENVDFSRLAKILEKKSITRAELSRKCGYCSDYATNTVFGKQKLNRHVADVLANTYGISREEYTAREDTKPVYKLPLPETHDLTVRIDEETLVDLALASVKERESVNDLVIEAIDDYLYRLGEVKINE